MKQSHQSLAMAGLLAVALAISGCAAMHGDKSSGTSGARGTSGATGNSGASEHGAGAPKAAPNSTVLAIEILPSSIGITEGDSSMGASGTGGATGSSGDSGPYRVTVRMDDGSTQVVNHDTTPDFRNGDRINVTSGAIVR